MTSSLTGGNSTFVVIGGSCGWTATGGEGVVQVGWQRYNLRDTTKG
ncbi:MAG: hypothetical protein ABSF48_17935 [Thermodesulfobacteriota bacterium]